MQQFFTEEGTYRATVRDSTVADWSKNFEVRYNLLPRFFLQHFESGVENISLGIDGAREKEAGNGYLIVEANKARMTFWFKNRTQVWALPLSIHSILLTNA